MLCFIQTARSHTRLNHPGYSGWPGLEMRNKNAHTLESNVGKVRNRYGNVRSEITIIPGIRSEEIVRTIPVDGAVALKYTLRRVKGRGT